MLTWTLKNHKEIASRHFFASRPALFTLVCPRTRFQFIILFSKFPGIISISFVFGQALCVARKVILQRAQTPAQGQCFEISQTTNPKPWNPKTLKHPKTVHPKTKTLKPLNPKPENPAFPAVHPAISPIIFPGQIVPVVGAKAAAAVVKVRAAPLGGTLLSDLCGSVLMLLGETSIYSWGFWVRLIWVISFVCVSILCYTACISRSRLFGYGIDCPQKDSQIQDATHAWGMQLVSQKLILSTSQNQGFSKRNSWKLIILLYNW